MSKSLIACSINTKECTVVRLKTSGNTGYSLSACKTLPSGLGDIASGKGKRLLNKLERYLKVLLRPFRVLGLFELDDDRLDLLFRRATQPFLEHFRQVREQNKVLRSPAG